MAESGDHGDDKMDVGDIVQQFNVTEQTVETNMLENAGSVMSQAVSKSISIGINQLRDAIAKENENENLEAIKLYKLGLETLIKAYKSEGIAQNMKATLHKHIKQYLTRAEQLKDKLKSTCLTDTQKQERMQLEGFILSQNDQVKIGDVIGNRNAIDILKECVILPFKFPKLFTAVSRRPHSLLLIGHAGTGKSMMARAIAAEIPNVTMFHISMYEFMGKTLKLKALFSQAEEQQPSIVCLDDMDMFESDQRDHDKVQQLRTDLLLEMSRLCDLSRTKSIQVTVTSQRPWTMQSSIRRRFTRIVLCDVPSKDDRREILKENMKNCRHSISEEDFDLVAERILSPSGHYCTQSDIVTLCRNVTMEPIRRIQAATHFRMVYNSNKDEYDWTPCSHDEEGSVQKNWEEILPDNFLEPEIVLNDFLKCLENFSGTVSFEEQEAMQNFVDDFVA